MGCFQHLSWSDNTDKTRRKELRVKLAIRAGKINEAETRRGQDPGYQFG